MNNITITTFLKGISILTALLMLSSCMQIKYSFISPGRVNHTSIKAHINYFSMVSDSITSLRKEKYEVIGHGIASWRYYPMGVSKKGYVYGNNNSKSFDIIKLMDNSFALDSTLSMELDAQYVASKDTIRKIYPSDGSYILHDIPNWNNKEMLAPDVLTYLHNNTIKKAVEHFVNKGYYFTSKMYIEIKVSGEYFQECDSQCLALANELSAYAKHFKRNDNVNWLCITSFSPYALEKFRGYLPEEIRNNFDYVLIAGYTGGWPKSKIAQAKGYVPEFNDSMSSFIIKTEWLNCVWFSSQGIKNFKILFSDIIKKRRQLHPEWKEISFSFSTYQKKSKKMKKMLTKYPNNRINIKSFMLDFDDRID